MTQMQPGQGRQKRGPLIDSWWTAISSQWTSTTKSPSCTISCGINTGALPPETLVMKLPDLEENPLIHTHLPRAYGCWHGIASLAAICVCGELMIN